jgi:anti-anti-sigma regulatory factor
VISFEPNIPRNLLEIRYGGVVRAEETEKGLEQLRASLAKLEAGFRVLVDLTELELMDVKCAPFVEKAMDLCNEKGASMVVRVVPDPHRDIGLQIMSVFHYRGDVRIITCQSLAEANEMLSSDVDI